MNLTLSLTSSSPAVAGGGPINKILRRKTISVGSPPGAAGNDGGRRKFAIFVISFLGMLVPLSAADSIAPVASTATAPDASLTLSTATRPAAIPGAHVLNLDDCIQRALAQATEVLKAKNALQTSGTQLLQAYFEFLPDLNASANYTYATGRNYVTLASPTFINTTNRGGAYQVTSTLNLFNGLSDLGNLRSSLQRKQYADLSLKEAEQQIVLDVTQAYLQVLLDRQIVKIGEGNLEASRTRQTLLEAQAQVGLRSLADLYRQEAETAADELYWINARQRARNDMILLLRRIRVDLLDPYNVADIPFRPMPAANPYLNEQALVSAALNQRADLRAAESLARATRWDVVTARGGYYPRLDLSGNIAGTGRLLEKQNVNGVDSVPPSQPSLAHQWGSEVLYTAGLTLNWGIFNRYLTRVSVARAQEIAKNTTIDSQDTRLLIEGEVEQAINDYGASLEQIVSAEKGLKAAQESYDAVQARYQVGASSIVDLLTAQSALVQAQAAQAQAHIALTLQDKTVQFALGTLPVQ
jgi:outer membrane protein